MPIKPENRSRYPANWQTIRDAVRARSRDHCEGSPDFPDCRRPNGWLLNKRTGEVTDDGQIAGTWELDGDKVTKIVLTVAHLGLPSHFPVHFHVTTSAQAHEVVEMVCFAVAPDAEQPEWAHMMHRRSLADFSSGSPAASAGFFIAHSSGCSGIAPRRAIVHQPLSVNPEAIQLTSWRLIAEPLEAARIAAKASASPQIEPADMKRLAASFARTLSEPTFRQAQCFVATGVRTSLPVIGGLLRSQGKSAATDDALALHVASALSTSGAGTRNPHSGGSALFSSALIRASIPRQPSVMTSRNTSTGI